ncbi:MAG: hypothetical protein AAF483_25755 [Planctomycetota bacterium]
MDSVASANECYSDEAIVGRCAIPALAPAKGYIGTITDSFARFAKRQYMNATMYKGHDDRRCEERHPLLVVVLAVGLNAQNEPIGQPFEMITRDVSDSALGLISAEVLQENRIAGMFELKGRNILFTAELIRRQSMGPYHGSAVRFVDELERFPVNPSDIEMLFQENLTSI